MGKAFPVTTRRLVNENVVRTILCTRERCGQKSTKYCFRERICVLKCIYVTEKQQYVPMCVVTFSVLSSHLSPFPPFFSTLFPPVLSAAFLSRSRLAFCSKIKGNAVQRKKPAGTRFKDWLHHCCARQETGKDGEANRILQGDEGCGVCI